LWEIFCQKKSWFYVEMELQELLAFAKQTQGPLKWDTSSLIHVGGVLAGKVNAIQGMSGQEKQKLVCQVLKTVLEDVEKQEKAKTQDDEEKKVISEQFASLRKAVDDVVPASLDLAFAAARGKLDLRKVKKTVWVKYFSCCAKSIVTALVSTNVISQAQANQATTALAAVEAKASQAAEALDGPSQPSNAAAEALKDETRFEQKNPMHTASQEGATQESKSEESPSQA
jgi:hypothetical protein